MMSVMMNRYIAEDLTPDQARHYVECIRQSSRFFSGMDDPDDGDDSCWSDIASAIDKNSPAGKVWRRMRKEGKLQLQSELGSREEWVRDIGHSWPMELING